MQKTLLISLIALVLVSAYAFGAEKTKPAENKHVKFTAQISEKTLKAGTAGTIQFSFTPAKGIHINLDPPMSFQEEKSASLSKVEKLVIPKDEKTGYLDASKPVTLKFTLAKNLQPGTVTLKGAFTYFYCSDAEGWCNRYKQPVELTVKVTK